MRASKLRGYLLVMLLSSIMITSRAQSFATPSLEVAARRLDLMPVISSYIQSDTMVVVSVGECTVQIRLKAGQVEHIGWPLFSAEVRQSMPSPVYDFLEYAVLDHHFRLNDNPLPLRQMKFISGSWKKLEAIAEKTDFGIDMQDGKYDVRWSNESGTLVEVIFPVNYELLLHDTRRNLIRSFVEELQRWKADAPALSYEKQRIVSSENPDIYVKRGDSYLSSWITSETYYWAKNDTTIESTDTLISQGYIPIWDASYPEESAANLMMDVLDLSEEVLIQLQFILDVKERKMVTVPLHQWLSFCRQKGCNLFWGVERRNEQLIIGSLFMQNNSLGYNHVALITIPVETIGRKRKMELKGRVHLYAPTTNVNDLFLEP